jgi:predicted lipoprotein with Yx(FWY)xxD motif
MKEKLYGVMAAAALGIALSACGSSGASKTAAPAVGASRYATAAGAPSTTTSPPTTAAPTTAVTAPAMTAAPAPVAARPATVTIAQNPKEGAILVDARGRTVYIFELDKGTTSSCTGGCSQVWPGFSAASPSAGPGLAMAKLGDATGQVSNQVTYNGHLLYFFAGDKAAGDIKGVGIKDWFPIGPDGNKVTVGSSDM